MSVSICKTSHDPDCQQNDSAITRRDIIALSIVVAGALLIRLFFLRYCEIISVDGTGYVGAARSMDNGDWSGITRSGFYPVLIWLAHLVIPDWEMAGRIVSILAGSLLAVPLYLLGREFFTRQIVLSACVVAVVWPSLRYWSCEVMTQATYITLTLAGIYLVWRMVAANSLPMGIGAGVCLGLAFLTRTEGLLLFLVTPLVPLFIHRSELRSRWRALLSYGGAFLLLFVANLLLIRQVTGSWQLAVKTSSALNDALGYYLGIEDLNSKPGLKQMGYLDIMRAYPRFVLDNSISNLQELWKTYLPIPLWLCAGFGLLAGDLARPRGASRLFLLGSFTPLLVILVFYYVGPEYTQPYIPITLLFAAAGVHRLGTLASQTAWAGRLLPAGGVCAGVPILLVAALAYGASIIGPSLLTPPTVDEDRLDQKNLGLLLKNKLPPGKIMTRRGRIAYYSEREWISMPNADLQTICRTARENGVRFLVIDGSLEGRQELEELLGPLISTNLPDSVLYGPEDRVLGPGLKPYLLYRNPASGGMAVYELVS